MWFDNISTLELVWKGVIVGIVASAPMGPVGILCIQRTLNKGRWYGLLTGCGAAVSDIIYAFITAFGMSFVMDFIQNEKNMFYLKLVGSILLFAFGLYTFMSNPTKNMHQSSNKKGTLMQNCITGFLVTISNPLIILLFGALFARFAFVVPDHPFEVSMGFMGILAGALLWWFSLTFIIDKVRTRVKPKGLRVINWLIGGCVMIFSVISLINTLFDLHGLDSLIQQ